MNRYGSTTVLLALALLASTGCASTRVVAVPVQSPTAPAWQAPAQGVVAGTAQDLSRWWEQLGDATLSSLIDRALRASPDVRTAQARLRQARAQLNVSEAGLRPLVTASASGSDRKDGAGAFQAGFDASWEPDVFGGNRQAVDAATADVAATAADAYGTEVSLAAEVARNYIDLRTLQTRMEIARRNEASQAETLELTTLRAQAGLVSSVDVEQARANLEQTRAQTPTLESTIAQTIHALATLAGLAPTALTASLIQAAPVPSVPPQVAVGIPAETLRQRPDVRAAEQRVLAETARVEQARTRRYPRFTLSGSLGTEMIGGALTGGTSLVASAAASALQTVLDAGKIRQQIAIQSAVQEQAVAGYQATVLAALEDVENALVAFERSRQRLASLDAAATAASNAALLARAQYTAGLADFQRVLDTERTVLSVQDSMAATAGDRVKALVQLYKALGGGWSPAADSSNTGNKTS
jgi:NodT family efflux transporter outer membrane factor (OMF) lipoprotein